MPTIAQLPSLTEVTPAGAIPVSQDGATRSVSVGALLASMQPAIMAETGTLLGRTSLGAGGPEEVTVGPGLLLNDGTLIASSFDLASVPQQTALSTDDRVMLDNDGTLAVLPLSSLRGLFAAGANVSIDAAGTISATGGSAQPYNTAALSVVTTAGSSDLLAINHAGTDHAISYANLLDGLTIDLAQAAAPATDSDTLWVAQGGSTMLRQTFAALSTWLLSRQPMYRFPVVEVTADTTLDGTIHNGRILICSQPATLSPAPQNMGNGFHCDVINLSGSDVMLGSGIVTSSGAAALPNGQSATIRVVTYSGGTVVFASLGGTTSGNPTLPEPPGQVTGLTAGSPTGNSITLSWAAPASGGAVSGYTVQHRVAGSTSWYNFATGITTTSTTVTGLAESTSYQFQVYGVNSGGSGLPAAGASVSTAAGHTGNVQAISWFWVPIGPYVHGVGAIGVNAMITPADAPVQFGFSNSATVPPATWVAAIHVNTNLWGTYVDTPASAGTWYVWIEGTDGSLPSVYETAFTVT